MARVLGFARRRSVQAGLVAGVITALVLGLAAPALACVATVTGTTTCTNTNHVVQWSLANGPVGGPMTVGPAVAQIGADMYAVTGFAATVASSTTTVGTSIVSGSESSMSGELVLSVQVSWPNDNFSTRVYGEIPDIGTACAGAAPTTTTMPVCPTTTTTTTMPAASPTTTTTTLPPTTTSSTTTPASSTSTSTTYRSTWHYTYPSSTTTSTSTSTTTSTSSTTTSTSSTTTTTGVAAPTTTTTTTLPPTTTSSTTTTPGSTTTTTTLPPTTTSSTTTTTSPCAAAGPTTSTSSTTSTTSTTTPYTPPVCSNVAAVSGNGRATVSWVTPSKAALSGRGGSPIIAYVVTPYIRFTALASQRFGVRGTADTVVGLKNGTTYRFRVAAVTANGTGPASAPTNPVTIGAPIAPTSVTAAVLGRNAAVRWRAPANANGAAITGYVVTPYRNGVAQRSHAFGAQTTAAVITGLASAKGYTFRVAAKNSRGTGPQSSASKSV